MSDRWLAWGPAAGEVLWWWGVSFGIWLLTLSSISAAEILVALSCGLVCGIAARAARIAVGGKWKPHPVWLWWLGPLAVAVVADTARVFVAAVRLWGKADPPVRPHEVQLPTGGSEDVSAAREALATLAVSAPPGTFVIDTDPDAHRLVVHTLVEGGPSVEEAVAR